MEDHVNRVTWITMNLIPSFFILIMKKIWRTTLKLIVLLLIVWIIAAQSCNEMRVDDKTATENFKKDGIVLSIHNEKINGNSLHYVSTGSDTLPVLVFVHGSPGSWNAFENYLKDSELLRRFYIISIDRPGFGYSDYGDAQHMNAQDDEIGRAVEQPVQLFEKSVHVASRRKGRRVAPHVRSAAEIRHQ